MISEMSGAHVTEAPSRPASLEQALGSIKPWTLLVAFGGAALLMAGSRALPIEAAWRRVVEGVVVCGALVAWVRVELPPHLSLLELAGPLAGASAWPWVVGLVSIQHVFVGSLLQLSSVTGWSLVRGDEASWLESEGLSLADAAYYLLVAVVLGPAAEELIFRGVLFRHWRARLGARTALLLSSALFGGLHFNHILISCIQGALLALLYARAGTLWAPMLAHSAQNALALALGAAPATGVQHELALTVLVALSALALVALARSLWPALSAPRFVKAGGAGRAPAGRSGMTG
jgi:membrane protease YdiL (CAAX protease family)